VGFSLFLSIFLDTIGMPIHGFYLFIDTNINVPTCEDRSSFDAFSANALICKIASKLVESPLFVLETGIPCSVLGYYSSNN